MTSDSTKSKLNLLWRHILHLATRRNNQTLSKNQLFLSSCRHSDKEHYKNHYVVLCFVKYFIKSKEMNEKILRNKESWWTDKNKYSFLLERTYPSDFQVTASFPACGKTTKYSKSHLSCFLYHSVHFRVTEELKMH